MEASQVLENELHLEVDGFVFKFYPRVWPRNYIGIVSEKQIAEMRKYLVYRSSHVVTQGTKLWWHLYFYRETHFRLSKIRLAGKARYLSDL